MGRAAELDALRGAVAGLEGGGPATVVLVGEPGIGKTRLLMELAAFADERGCIVLAGSGAELEADLPFAVFVDALDEYVAGLDPRRLASLEEEIGAELGRVLPSLSGLARSGEPALADERYRAHRAVRELLERIAATKPLVLVLDDVHWADPASIELIGALLRRPPAAAVLLVLAARPRQLPDRLAAALERTERTGSLGRIELGALDREEAGELLGCAMDAALADRVYHESGGNPFYLEQLARSPHLPEASAPEPTLVDLNVPAAVLGALAEELGTLPQLTRTLLQGAAVAGDPFEPELAAAAAGVGAEAAMPALDELLALELVRTTNVPRRFRFRHPLVRRAVYESAPAAWVLGAHERCAEALADRGAAPTVRAHHVEHAARHGDAAAVALLREAAQESALRAPASAARWFAAAQRLLPDSASTEARVGLLLARAQALGATGRLDESREALLESIALAPTDDIETRVRLTVACAGIEHMLGRHPDARARITDALDQLPDPAGTDAVTLRIVLAFDGLFRADLDAMRNAAELALEAARPLGQRPLTALAAAVLALACARDGAMPEAEAASQDAAALVDAMPDAELAGRIDAAAHLAAAELFMDRYEQATAHAERALAIARATGQAFPTLIPVLASAHVTRGRLEEAIELIDSGVESARLAHSPQDLAWRLHIRSVAALAAGDLDTALDAAQEAFELTRELDENFVRAYPALGLAQALQSRGDAARAVEVLVAAVGGEELPLIPRGWRTMGHELLVRCYLELGQPEDAARVVDFAQDTAAGVRLPIASAWAERAAGAVALDAGEPAAAAQHALSSAASAETVGAVIEAALSRTLAGRALSEAGEAEQAAAELSQAAAVLDACGARRYRDAAEQELRRQGRRIHRQTRATDPGGAGIASLTERELEVAQLVVARKTNAEIAAELFLSVKTIESHMRNLFHKLNVSSRVDVAKTIERAEHTTEA